MLSCTALSPLRKSANSYEGQQTKRRDQDMSTLPPLTYVPCGPLALFWGWGHNSKWVLESDGEPLQNRLLHVEVCCCTLRFPLHFPTEGGMCTTSAHGWQTRPR